MISGSLSPSRSVRCCLRVPWILELTPMGERCCLGTDIPVVGTRLSAKPVWQAWAKRPRKICCHGLNCFWGASSPFSQPRNSALGGGSAGDGVLPIGGRVVDEDPSAGGQLSFLGRPLGKQKVRVCSGSEYSSYPSLSPPLLVLADPADRSISEINSNLIYPILIQ